MSTGRPVCRRCGYDLSGQPVHSRPACSECGLPFDPENPSGVQPWPSPLSTILALIAPAIGATVITVLGRLLGTEMISVVLLISYVVVIGGSTWVVTTLCDRHLAAGSKRITRGVWITTCIVVNVIAWFVAVAVLS
jgi:hypothetical protein